MTLNKTNVQTLPTRRLKTQVLGLFEGLVFNPTYHSYRFASDDLANVSSFVNKLTPDFDPKMAERVAQSKGAKGLPAIPDYYTQRWALMRDESAARGTRVHLFAEQYPTLDEPIDNLEEGVCNFYDWMEDNGYEVVLMELRMTDGDLAGTCDLLLRHKETGVLIIADWKTNAKDIDAIKHYHKPLTVFTDIKGNDVGKYTVQVNMYKYILETKGLEIGGLWLVHLSDMYEDNFKIIEVPALDVFSEMQEGKVLREMLLDFKEELREKKLAREAKYKNKSWSK